ARRVRAQAGDGPAAPVCGVRGAEAARPCSPRPLVPLRARRLELRVRNDPRRGGAALRLGVLPARGRDRLAARLRPRPLPARRARGRRAGDPPRYSSSEARSSPAPITASEASRLIQIPIPRPPAGRNSSGIEMSRIRTKIVAREPRAITIRLSGTVGRSEEHTSELQSQSNLVCRLLLE